MWTTCPDEFLNCGKHPPQLLEKKCTSYQQLAPLAWADFGERMAKADVISAKSTSVFMPKCFIVFVCCGVCMQWVVVLFLPAEITAGAVAKAFVGTLRLTE